MMRRTLLFSPLLFLLLPGVCRAQAPSAAATVAKRFLPPKARMAEITGLDPKTGKPGATRLAVLSGHIVSPTADDIVFSYYTAAPDLPAGSLFIVLLHKTDSGYVKLAEFSYYANRFLSADGFRLLRPPREGRDLIAVYTGVGASLGGQVRIFRWDSDWGLVNAMPENGSVHGVLFIGGEEEFAVRLIFEKYQGEKGAPPALRFRWDGKKFAKAGDE